jgi:hypothetical protein
MKVSIDLLPRRIFIDSCTAQTLRDYGGYIYESQAILVTDRIFRIPDGIENVDALRTVSARPAVTLPLSLFQRPMGE